MSTEQDQLEAGIAAMEAQRQVLGDTVVDAALTGLYTKLVALRAPAAPGLTQTLKQVSVLFLDVVGSTTLSQRLDPEEISAVMDDALARGTDIVDAHRGRVLQYAGDNILAAFGADEATEDDAERAVRCGLALLELGRTLGSEVERQHQHAGFNVRVGIHTGGVLLGGGIDQDGNIRGIAVNIAARMEQTAPAGGLRISHDTYAQVRGLFEISAPEPLRVKGVDDPIVSYLVVKAKPRSFRIAKRGIEGVATRMIGREAEFEALQVAFKRLFTERQLLAVSVVAEAGIGKSRLLDEFQAWTEDRPETVYLFRGRATPQTQGQPFGLLRDIVAWRLQLSDDDTLAEAKAKIEAGLMPLFADESEFAKGHAHLLGHLIGLDWKESPHLRGILDDPKQIRNRAQHAAAQMFRRVSQSDGSPVILQLEDLHWADDESLDFLNYLAEVNRDMPLLMLAFTRPTLFERRADWRTTDTQAEGRHQRIDLHPLDKTGSRMLVNELLKKLPEVPAALRELITGGAEGNPFYMEELVRMLIDQGAIDASGDPWRLNAERQLATKVPPTLTGVLQARLDGLPADERLTLQEASVIGQVFWDRALVALDAQNEATLPRLVQRELALPRLNSELDGLREYAFRHSILHQVTYGTVLKRQRKALHAKLARWLAAQSQSNNARAGDFLSLTAQHYAEAGDDANAAEFHARAAEHAVQRFAHERVTAHVGQALSLLGEAQPAQGELRWRLLSAREVTLLLQGRQDDQAADIDALALLADRLDDDWRRAYAAWRRGIRAMRIADWVAMERAARQGMTCATRAGDDGLRLHALRLLATARGNQDDIQSGRALAQQGLVEARGLELHAVEARLLNALGLFVMQEDLLGAQDLFEQSTRILAKTGDRLNEAIGLSNIGLVWLKLGDLEQGRRDLDAALKIVRANGDRAMEGSVLSRLSSLVLWQGDATRALALARSSLDIAAAVQARDVEVVAGLKLGDAELALGRLAAARQAYAEVQARALEIGHPIQHDASAGLARVAMAHGDAVAAVAAVKTVLDHAAAGRTLGGTEFARQVELTCHQALARAGDPRASDWLARAHAAMKAQADRITDATLRQGFLHNIPYHREIRAAWEMWRAPDELPSNPMG